MSLSWVGGRLKAALYVSIILTSLKYDSADTRRGEVLMGFYVRAGFWIDGIEILTSFGRKSGIYGNATGGSG